LSRGGDKKALLRRSDFYFSESPKHKIILIDFIVNCCRINAIIVYYTNL